MACEKPLRAYTAATGGRVRFWKSTDKEYYQENYTGLEIPCGTCILCREEYARQTAVRITHEATLWVESSFLTLTYDDKNLPAHNSLDYDHLVKFWKRLRKRLGPLRYYAVGEYGDKTKRPHYHACIFGHAFIENRIMVKEGDKPLWTTAELEQIWGLGQVRVGQLNFATARYTASYVVKKLRKKQRYTYVNEETGELIPLAQPRAFMSKNLGKGWWDKWNKGVIDHDWIIIDGKKQKPPKAYDRWLREVNEEKLIEIKEKRIEKAVKLTAEETRARARNAHAHTERKNKSI